MGTIDCVKKPITVASIRYKLLLLYVLNVMDLLFTLTLLETDKFIEANPLMNFVFNKNSHLAIKLFLPAILLLYVSYRIQSANHKQLRISRLLLDIINGIYILITLSHLYWLFLY